MNKHQGVCSEESKDGFNRFIYSNEPMNPISILDSRVQGSNRVMNPNEPLNLKILETQREHTLEEYRKKQPFRVSIGKSTWINYEPGQFKPEYNLREILKDEIVIEFDSTDLDFVVRATSATCINLINAGYSFEYWDHSGKSPHIHIHNLPINHLDDNKRALFKKMFIRKYVPLEYLSKVDFSLTGIHLIALEWANHWKRCYSIKKLIAKCEGGIYK